MNNKKLLFFATALLANSFFLVSCGNNHTTSTSSVSSSSLSSASNSSNLSSFSSSSSLFSSSNSSSLSSVSNSSSSSSLSSSSSSSNSSSLSSASSFGTNSNEAGFFGEEVKIGGHKIVGRWEVSGYSYITFYSDGTAMRERFDDFRAIYPQYGLTKDGKTLTIIDASGDKTVYSLSYSDDNCFGTLLKIYEPDWFVEFCKADDPEPYTLNPVDNSHAQKNDFGYFGPEVQLGNTPVVGYWGYVPIEGGGGHCNQIELEEDGSGLAYGGNAEISYLCGSFLYAVSEDGRTLMLQYQYQTDVYQIIDLFEGCYKMIFEGSEYKLCKSIKE